MATGRYRHVTYIRQINKIKITFDYKTMLYYCKGENVAGAFYHLKDAIDYCNEHKPGKAKNEND